jgi:DNA modification methylase
MKPYFQDDTITIYNGDNREVLPLLVPSIDLTVTSPPYGEIRDYEGFVFDFETVASELFRVTKTGGVVVWVEADETVNGSETGASFLHALRFKEIGFNLHDTMIHLRDCLAYPSNNRYFSGFEYMFILSNGNPKTFNPIKDRKNVSVGHDVCGTERKKDGTLGPRAGAGKVIPEMSMRFNYWLLRNQKRGLANLHPATFSEQLAGDHIRSWSNPDDTILDPFMGSGTTGKMARINGCKFIGIEISEKYCEIAVKRLSQRTLNFGTRS